MIMMIMLIIKMEKLIMIMMINRNMYVSVAFFWREAFAELDRLPLSLTQGNIAANVEDLVGWEIPPDEPTAKQMWNCVRGGVVAQAFVVRLLTSALAASRSRTIATSARLCGARLRDGSTTVERRQTTTYVMIRG